MITRSVQAKMLVFAVFLIGTVTGALVDNTYHTRVISAPVPPANDRGDRKNPQEQAKRDEDSMAKYLALDQSQQDQIHKILEGMRNDLKDLHEQLDPQYKAIQEGARAKIRALLTPEQQKKADAFRESHRGNRGRPSGPQDKSDKSDKK